MGRRKIAFIVAWLVPEAEEKDNESIAKEIREELESGIAPIPYAERIEKVMVLSEKVEGGRV